MSASWTLYQSGAWRSFASLGLANLRRVLVSQAVDTVSFTAPGAAADSAPLFSFGDACIIRRDATRWFYGVVTDIRRAAAPDDERLLYTVSGPFWHLEQCIYQQTWTVWDSGLAALVTTDKARVILNRDNVTGAAITSAAQIQAAVQYAIDKGAPIQLGTVDSGLYIPWEEVVDLSCAEVIFRMLRWAPDCVAWFDYSTTPYPTFHCRGRAALSALSLSRSTLNHSKTLASHSLFPLLDPCAAIVSLLLFDHFAIFSNQSGELAVFKFDVRLGEFLFHLKSANLPCFKVPLRNTNSLFPRPSGKT